MWSLINKNKKQGLPEIFLAKCKTVDEISCVSVVGRTTLVKFGFLC